MLVYCWLKRSIPALLLLTAIACSGGLLKPYFAANPTGRRGSKESAPLGTGSLAAASVANHSVANHSAAISNPGRQTSGQGAAAGEVDDWVRTRTGWEHEAKWFATVGRYEPTLHPAVVAALVSLVALWGLVAFPADPTKMVEDPDGSDTTFTTDN